MSLHSPSSINCFYNCKLKYYYQYKEKLPTKKSLAMIKGTITHATIYDLFQYKYHPDLKKIVPNILEEKIETAKKSFNLNEIEVKECYREISLMMKLFVRRIDSLIEGAMIDGRVKTKSHAWNLIRPRMNEQKLISEDLKIQGIIDAIEETYDKKVIIVDYKTSKLYGNSVSSDYFRQLILYALLYFEKEKKLPDFVAVNYIRYGIVQMFQVNENMIEDAKKIITFIENNTKSSDKKEYPANITKLCEYCDYRDICDEYKKTKS